jgi:hypothetical protein
MFRALSCQSSGALSNCSRSLRLPCECGGGRVSSRPPPHSHGNRRLRLQFERAPDDWHDSARNMLSGGYVTKQLMLRLIFASGLGVLFEYLRMHGTTNPKKSTYFLNCCFSVRIAKYNSFYSNKCTLY